MNQISSDVPTLIFVSSYLMTINTIFMFRQDCPPRLSWQTLPWYQRLVPRGVPRVSRHLLNQQEYHGVPFYLLCGTSLHSFYTANYLLFDIAGGGWVHDLRMDGGLSPGFQKGTLF